MIHRNLCISLMIAELVFLFGVDKTENKVRDSNQRIDSMVKRKDPNKDLFSCQRQKCSWRCYKYEITCITIVFLNVYNNIGPKSRK